MALSPKIYVPVLLVILVAASLYGYFIFSSRSAEDGGKVIRNENQAENGNNGQGRSDEATQGEFAETDEISGETEIDIDIVPEEETTLFQEITREDCLGKCENFKEDEQKEYCFQSCGIVPLQEGGSENEEVEKNDCSEKTGLQKDYCLKDLGISEQDFRICERITDRNIRNACALRITEDILEKFQIGG